MAEEAIFTGFKSGSFPTKNIPSLYFLKKTRQAVFTNSNFVMLKILNNKMINNVKMFFFFFFFFFFLWIYTHLHSRRGHPDIA